MRSGSIAIFSVLVQKAYHTNSGHHEIKPFVFASGGSDLFVDSPLHKDREYGNKSRVEEIIQLRWWCLDSQQTTNQLAK